MGAAWARHAMCELAFTRVNVRSQETETCIGRSTHIPTARTSKLIERLLIKMDIT